jgi:WD40 repeat protein
MPPTSRVGPSTAGFLIAAFLFATFLTATLAAAADAPPTFDGDVLPILREKCCSCHNPDKKKGGLDLTSHGQTLAGGGSGEVIAAGDPDGSYLWQVVSHASEPKMPPESDKLPDAMLNVIKRWIEAGAIEKSGAAPVARKTSAIALPAGAAAAPEGPPVMPPRLSLEVLARGRRATTVTALAASPHGEVVALGGRKQVLLYHAGTLDFLGVLPFPEGVVKALRFTRNGKLLLAGGGAAAKSGRVVVWDVATAGRVVEVGEEFDEVLAADISPDQRLVALGGPAKVVRLLATADGAVKAEIRRHTDWITALEFSPDGKMLATGDRAGNLHLWETRGARDAGVLKGHGGPITTVAWRRDGGLVASSSADGTVRLWDPKEAKQVKSITAHGGGAESLAWLADGRLVSAGHDKRVKLWKADGNLERELPPLAEIGTRVAVTADGGRILAGDWTGAVTVFATADGKPAGTLDTLPPPIEDRLRAAEKVLTEVAATGQSAAEKAKAATDALAVAESQMAAARKAAEEAAAELAAVKAREAEAAKAVERWKAEAEFAHTPPPAK